MSVNSRAVDFKFNNINNLVLRGDDKELVRLWSHLETKIGSINLSYVRGIKRPGEDFTENFTSLASPVKKISYANQVLEGLFWLQYAKVYYLGITNLSCQINGDRAALTEFEKAHLFTDKPEMDPTLPCSTAFLDMLQTNPELASNIGINNTKALQNNFEHQSFALGVSLYMLFTQKHPYPLIENRGDYYLDPNRITSIDQRAQRNELLKAGSTEKLANLIVKLIHPVPSQRARARIDIPNYVSSYNPLIAGWMLRLN